MRVSRILSVLAVVSVLFLFSLNNQMVSAEETRPPIDPDKCETGECIPHRSSVYDPDFKEPFLEKFDPRVIGSAYLAAYTLMNRISAVYFSPNGDIIFEIFDSPGGTLLYTDSGIADSGGYLSQYLNFDLAVGHYIVVTDVSTATEVTMTVAEVTLMDIDTDTDVYSGTANPYGNLAVGFDDYSTGTWTTSPVTADENGNWSFDFTTLTDVVPFGWYVAYIEYDGNLTVSTFPWFRAELKWDGANFIGYSKLHTVTWIVKDSQAGNIIHGPEAFSFENNWTFKGVNFDLQSGHYIHTTDDNTGIVKDHIVQIGSIDNVNFATDVVSGTAPPNSYLEVIASNWSSFWDSLYTQADGSGNWSVDFTGLRDIDASMYIELNIADNDNDRTWIFWEVPYMEFNPYNISRFREFTPNNQIEVSLYQNNSKTSLLWGGLINTDENGYAQMNFTDFGCVMIEEGNYIEALDVGTGIVKGLEYKQLRVTEVNEASAYASGTGPPYAWIEVSTNDQNGWKNLGVQANASGNWVADFSSAGSTEVESFVYADYFDYDHDYVHAGKNNFWLDTLQDRSKLKPRMYWDGEYYNACYGQDLIIQGGFYGDSNLDAELDALEIDITIDGIPQFNSYVEALEPFSYPPLGEVVSWDNGALVHFKTAEYNYAASTLSAGEHSIHVVAYDTALQELWFDVTFTVNVMPSVAPPPLGMLNGAVEIVSDQPIVAIGRPHIGTEIMAYNGSNTGATTVYLPMLFNGKWNYTSTFTVQNTSVETSTFSLTFKNAEDGSTSCTMSGESLPRHGVKTYDVTNLGPCDSGFLPVNWFGGATISSDQPVIAVAKPDINGTDAVTYNGFTGGAATTYLPMLFRGKYGYQAAFYVQNLDPALDANLTIEFYDADGNFTCTYADPDPIGPSVTRGYWMAGINDTSQCLGGTGFPVSGWAGSAVINTGAGSSEIVAIGRPHLGAEVAAYNGFTAGGQTNYLPMLFRGQWGYDSAFYIQNISGGFADISVDFYDVIGNYTCTYTDPAPLGPNATRGYWTPALDCNSGGSFPASGWAGSAEISTNQNVIAVGRPHLSSNQVVVYNAFTGGANQVFAPYNFRKWAGNETALYIQNLGPSDATATIRFYDEEDGFYCQMEQVVTPGSAGAIWLAALNNSVCVP